MKVIYYLNQFFGQIGGEEKAHTPPTFVKGGVGPSDAFSKLVDDVELVGTIICGDNYFNENEEIVFDFLNTVYENYNPDLIVAGPAFNAGRYGMACAGVAKFFKEKNITVVTGMYKENPGLEECKGISYIVKTGDSAAKMRNAMKSMVNLVDKLVKGEELKPEIDNYFPMGIRNTVLVEKNGSQRAVEMLLKRLDNKEFNTELPMPKFDKVDPAVEIKDLSKATIALVTSGGIVPMGNPDKIQSASAQKWGKYDISKIDKLKGEYFTIHGGYDPVYANENPDRVVPLDMLKNMENEGKIGNVYKYFYTTTGTGTSVDNSINFGNEIGKELKNAGVDGVILTST